MSDEVLPARSRRAVLRGGAVTAGALLAGLSMGSVPAAADPGSVGLPPNSAPPNPAPPNSALPFPNAVTVPVPITTDPYASMPWNTTLILMWLSGIGGEITIGKGDLRTYSSLSSVAWTLSAARTSRGGKAAPNRSTPSSMRITGPVSIALPVMFDQLSIGQAVPECLIDMYRDGDTRPFTEIEMNPVVFGAVAVDGVAGSRPTFVAEFAFKHINFVYSPDSSKQPPAIFNTSWGT